MDETKVKMVYKGGMGGFSCDAIGVQNCPRGQVFEAPKWFADEKLRLEPNDWELQTTAAKPIKKGGE